MAVIGVGHLGKEHARILAGLPDVELVGVADVNGEQVQVVARQCGTRAYTTYWPLLNLVDAACIVVPTVQHHAIASEFLRRGIPLLVEKPLASNLEQASALVDFAHQHGALLQVGHIERFNPAFEELQRHPMQPKLVECQRIGPFTGRSTDIGAVLDLMIHDLDLLLTLVQAEVRAVDALGAAIFGGHEDVVNARVSFTNGCVANLTASRVSPQPVRQMRIWAPEGYASVDFAKRRLTLVQPSEHLRFNGLDPRRLEPGTRAWLKDDLFGTHLQVRDQNCDHGDQLTRELLHFVHCVQTGARPRVSGEEGRKALDLAARILESVRTHQWEGHAAGATGPSQMPPRLGPLFQANEGGAAA
jgi:predicted dehydrogenase